MVTPAEARVPAPKSMASVKDIPPALAALFARPGYVLSVAEGSDPPELLVRRSGKVDIENDPGALAPHVDHPFDDAEVRNLRMMVALFETPAEV